MRAEEKRSDLRVTLSDSSGDNWWEVGGGNLPPPADDLYDVSNSCEVNEVANVRVLRAWPVQVYSYGQGIPG